MPDFGGKRPRFHGPPIPADMRNIRIGSFTIGPRGPTRADIPQGMTGVVIVRHNAPSAAKELAELRRRIPTAIIKNHEERASILQSRLRALALAAYSKSGTGRFARGIFARVRKLENGAAIIVTVVNYRESRFLTNLGGRGYFQSGYPVPPYRIYAKGAEGLDQNVDPFTGKVHRIGARSALRVARDLGIGRLKVPRRGVFFEAFRQPGRGGGEQRRPVDAIGGFNADETSAAFFYPLWTNHPGFQRDVLADAMAEENAKYINDVQTLMRFEHENLGAGKFRSTPMAVTAADQTVERVVSNVIPLQPVAITLARGRLRTSASGGRGAIDASGFQLLKRASDVL